LISTGFAPGIILGTDEAGMPALHASPEAESRRRNQRYAARGRLCARYSLNQLRIEVKEVLPQAQSKNRFCLIIALTIDDY
jgi:hypothetical protein